MTPKSLLNQWSQDARQTRIAERLTQAELARHAGVGLGLVKRFEAGGGITLHAFVRIATALGRANALGELLRPPEPISGLGVAKSDLEHLTIADLEAAQVKQAPTPRGRVRHARVAKGRSA